MRHSELITAITIRARFNAKDVEKILDAYTATVLESVKRGDVVTHKNFLTYFAGRRSAHVGVNPRTRAPVMIHAAKILRGRPAKKVLDFLN